MVMVMMTVTRECSPCLPLPPWCSRADRTCTAARWWGLGRHCTS
jgi:hypothetical protein